MGSYANYHGKHYIISNGTHYDIQWDLGYPTLSTCQYSLRIPSLEIVLYVIFNKHWIKHTTLLLLFV